MNGGMHISQEDLALYAMQALDGEELKALRAHLPTCAQCREQLQVIAGDLTALGLSVEQHPVPEAARLGLLVRHHCACLHLSRRSHKRHL